MSELVDYLAEKTERTTPFVVEDDGGAEWAFRKLQKIEREMTRVRDQASQEMARITDWVTDTCGPLEREKEFFEGLLIAYMHKLRANDEDVKTYKLPAGTLTAREQPESILIENEEGFLKWAEEHLKTVLTTKIMVSPDKSALKKLIKDGKVVTEDGEVVPGVTVEKAPVKYAVKVTE